MRTPARPGGDVSRGSLQPSTFRTARILVQLAAASLAVLTAAPALAQACEIQAPHKFGVGAWAVYGTSRMEADLGALRASWFYDWGQNATTRSTYVPMIWSAQDVAYASSAPGDTLLTFNEPDNRDQANLSVSEALSYWPALMAAGKRLGSPAVTTGNELGGTTWLAQFMSEAERRDYRVDFIAVHYYTADPSISAFERYLSAIHQAYSRPIWVTEWSLADWNDENRFTEEEQAAFLRAGAEMMDDLPYVERHAWFGLYEGLDDWEIRSGLYAQDGPTHVGDAFLAVREC
jgi:hypothetical protein